jgi:DNA invertase Pin-like site-specific DNA recombinase
MEDVYWYNVTMAKIGYARVSTREQKDDSQIDELKAYGCDPERIFTDKGVSGKLAERPELDKALAYLRKDDVFVITRMSRAMRSLKHMIALAEDLDRRGVGLVVLKQNIDTTTPTGRLVFHILASIDEFQRELIVEGTLEGLEAARARGRIGGRKSKLSPEKIRVARQLYDEKDTDGKRRYTVTQVGDMFGVSRQTIYRCLEPEQPGPSTNPRQQEAS